MAVAPGPIFVLFFAVEAIEFTIFVVTFSEPHAIGAILACIPVMIIGIIRIIDAGSGSASGNRQRSKRGAGQQERAEEAFAVSHGISPEQRWSSRIALELDCEMLTPETTEDHGCAVFRAGSL
jgi:hypothetical protein